MVRSLHPWHSQLGSQRDWIWRGWRVRYTHQRPSYPNRETEMPILLLHGFGAALTQWRLNLAPLSQHQTVYALDLLGFGASEKAIAASYTIDLWIEQVYDFWRTFIRQPMVLVGHSLGALVALTAATTYPDMAKGLVLITLPSSRQELLPKQLQPIVSSIEGLFASPLLINPLFYLVRRPTFIRSALRQVYFNPERITDDLVSSFVMPALDRGAANVLCRLVKARTRTDFSPNTTVLFPRLQRPTLLLWGACDRVIPLSWGRQLPRLNPNVQLVEIPDAGHCPYDEASERVNQEILQWLELLQVPRTPFAP